jgi:hypothetical protein
MCHDMMNSGLPILAQSRVLSTSSHLSSSLHDASTSASVLVAAKAWSTSHPRTTSPPLCHHQLVLSYARTVLFVLFHYLYLVLLYVLVLPCSTVTKVSCRAILPKYCEADSKVLTNRKYGVATVWYVPLLVRS